MTDHVNRDPHPAGHGHPHGHPHGAPASVPGTISHDLRESTSDLHTAAERSELQRLLVSGRASRSQYAEHLSQMFLVHRALDAALRAASEASPAVRTVVRDEHFQEPYLREDLAFLGVNPESIEPVPATTAMTARIAGVAAADPVALLGYHYVLEGANNGNRFIARAVAGVVGQRPGGPGTRYLDPYGERQREVWSAFKRDIDSVELDAATRGRMIGCAREMFAAVATIGDEVIARTSMASVSSGAPGPALS